MLLQADPVVGTVQKNLRLKPQLIQRWRLTSSHLPQGRFLVKRRPDNFGPGSDSVAAPELCSPGLTLIPKVFCNLDSALWPPELLSVATLRSDLPGFPPLF